MVGEYTGNYEEIKLYITNLDTLQNYKLAFTMPAFLNKIKLMQD